MAVAFLALVVLAGGAQVHRSLGCLLGNDPRVLYLLAEYKMAVGDTSTALRLLKASNAKDHPVASTTAQRSEPARQAKCPYSGTI